MFPSAGRTRLSATPRRDSHEEESCFRFRGAAGAKTGEDLVGPTYNLVLSPAMIAMWRPMAVASSGPSRSSPITR